MEANEWVVIEEMEREGDIGGKTKCKKSMSKRHTKGKQDHEESVKKAKKDILIAH